MISSYRRQHRAPRRAGRPPWGIAALWTCVPGAAWYLGRFLGRGAVGGWLGFVGETSVGAALLLVALDPQTMARQRRRPAGLRPCVVMP
jgi:hypothetical protein